MTKKIKDQEEVVVAEAVSKTEKFFEAHGKKVIVALVALLIVFAGGYAYKYFVFDKNNAAADELIIKAQERFGAEDADYELALNGDENGAGFLEIIEQYGSTEAGNLACHYAGICYLRLGKLEEAKAYLEKFSPVGSSHMGDIINAQNLGLQGDVAVELGNYEEAAKLFAKAVAESDNNYTAPYYLYKQALALQAAGKAEEAKACCQTIVEKYPNSMEKSAAEKLF